MQTYFYWSYTKAWWEEQVSHGIDGNHKAHGNLADWESLDAEATRKSKGQMSWYEAKMADHDRQRWKTTEGALYPRWGKEN